MVSNLALALLLAVGSSVEPTWVTKSGSPGVWRQLEEAFSAQLAPEDPARTAPYVALQYRYIARVARVGSHFLVVVGGREQRLGPRSADYFRLYTFDASTGSPPTELPDPGFVGWRFSRWVHLDVGAGKELLFKHQTCSECEAEYLLSSVYFSSQAKAWRLRSWPDDGTHILIGSDVQHGYDDDYATSCARYVGPYSRSSLDDILVWCRVSGLETRRVEDAVYLFTTSGGFAERRTLSGPARDAARAFLCRAVPTHPLCR